MKSILITAFVFLTACNSEVRKNSELVNSPGKTSTYQNYPLEIIKLGIEKWYDEAKWAMYCIYCNDTCNFQKETGIKDIVTFATLDLRLENVVQFGDTTEIELYFYYDTLKCDITTVRNLGLASGAGFKKGSDSILYYTSTGTMHRFWNNDTTSRFKIPLQKQVNIYLQRNQSKLHPWFYKEARKRNVIQ